MSKLNLVYLTLFVLVLGFTYSCGDDSDETTEPSITTINITSNYDELYIDDEVVLTSEVLDDLGNSLDKSVNWSISGPGEITTTFSQTTKVKATSEGTIEVTAELDGVSTTKTIKVLSGTASIYDYLFPSQLENPKIVFTWLTLIYKKVDIPANSARGHGRIEKTLPDAAVEAYVEEMRKFEAFTADYTGGEIGFNMAVVVLDEQSPLSDFYWDNNKKKYEWVEGNDIKREMDIYVGSQNGWFDHINVYYAATDWGPTAGGWGGGDYMRDNITRGQFHHWGDINTHEMRVGTWHEWIHGLEKQYWFDSKRSGTCQRGNGPDGNKISLHGQPAFGYVGNQGYGRGESENYFHWMADLTTGNIRDLTSIGWQNYDSGSNTNLGFGKNGMYTWGPVRYEYDFKPGGPFPQD